MGQSLRKRRCSYDCVTWRSSLNLVLTSIVLLVCVLVLALSQATIYTGICQPLKPATSAPASIFCSSSSHLCLAHRQSHQRASPERPLARYRCQPVAMHRIRRCRTVPNFAALDAPLRSAGVAHDGQPATLYIFNEQKKMLVTTRQYPSTCRCNRDQ